MVIKLDVFEIKEYDIYHEQKKLLFRGGYSMDINENRLLWGYYLNNDASNPLELRFLRLYLETEMLNTCAKICYL